MNAYQSLNLSCIRQTILKLSLVKTGIYSIKDVWRLKYEYSTNGFGALSLKLCLCTFTTVVFQYEHASYCKYNYVLRKTHLAACCQGFE